MVAALGTLKYIWIIFKSWESLVQDLLSSLCIMRKCNAYLKYCVEQSVRLDGLSQAPRNFLEQFVVQCQFLGVNSCLSTITTVWVQSSLQGPIILLAISKIHCESRSQFIAENLNIFNDVVCLPQPPTGSGGNMSQRTAHTLASGKQQNRLMFQGVGQNFVLLSGTQGGESFAKFLSPFHWLWPSDQGIISLQALQQALKWLSRKLPVHMTDWP